MILGDVYGFMLVLQLGYLKRHRNDVRQEGRNAFLFLLKQMQKEFARPWKRRPSPEMD